MSPDDKVDLRRQRRRRLGVVRRRRRGTARARSAACAPAAPAGGRRGALRAGREPARARARPRREAFSTSPGSDRVTSMRSTRPRAQSCKTPTSAPSRSACSSRRTDRTVYVACSMDDAVVALDAPTLAVTAQTACARKPWSLAWSADRTRIYVTHLARPRRQRRSRRRRSPSPRLGPSPTAPPGNAPTVPHGIARGIYDVLAASGIERDLGSLHDARHRHAATDARFPEHRLPRASASSSDRRETSWLASRVSTAPGDNGAFVDVVSGPRALVFLARREARLHRRHRQRGPAGHRRAEPDRAHAHPPALRPSAGGRRSSRTTATSTSTSATPATSRC